MSGLSANTTTIALPQPRGHRGLSRIAALILALCCLLGLTSTTWALEPPAFHGYVNDYAGMLNPDTALELEQALKSFEQMDSTQVAVLTIDSLEGDSLEDFSIRTVEKWKIGQKGKDNGVLLLIVKNDRKIRIEVGRGLEGVLTDLAAGRIVNNIIRPLFKEGRFNEGIRDGVAAIIQTCRGEFKAEPGATREARGRGRGSSPDMGYLVFGLFIISFLGRASRPLGILSGAILLPLIVFFGFSSFSLLLLLLLMPVGAVGGLVLPFLFSNMIMGGGGFGGGGFGGGDSGGFGGFGGGSFGGGGASGGW